MAKLNIFQQVRELENWRATAFALTLTERMYPNYQLFCEITGFADASVARHLLNLLWDWIAVTRSKINFEVQLLKLEEVTPEPRSFDNYGVFPALDFVVSLESVVNQISGEDAQGAVVVSKVSQGCVESYIEATAEEELDNETIKHHPLMQWERDFQQDLINLLTSDMKRNRETVNRLRDEASLEGISNIGIEISK